MNSDQLLAQAQKMDPQALAAIHDRYYMVVYRYVHYRLDDEMVVEDITSEVFIRLINALQKGEGSIKNVQAWLLGTASHIVHDHLRHKYRRPTESIEIHENLPSNNLTEVSVEDNLEKGIVRKAMQKLTEEQQHVLALRFSSELTIEDTARAMKKSINAVKVLQFRALSALRRHVNIGREE
jgi:RNA polymerase sigma-70 factor, ECF subfamily